MTHGPTDYTTRLVPHTEAFTAVAKQVFAERKDLQQQFGSVDSPGFRVWVAANGPIEYPDRIGPFYPPIPPEHLRVTGCGGSGAQTHLWTGVEDVGSLLLAWDAFGERPLDQIRSVLDFGCACGRLLRWMPLVLPGAAIHGVDVRQGSIEWCRQNLRGDFVTNGTLPPLQHLPDGSIDLVCALSVFSHLNQESSRAWLAELARVCHPQGRIVATVLGPFALWVLLRSAQHQRNFGIDDARARGYLHQLRRDGFAFHPLPPDRLSPMEGVEQDYGYTFVSEAFAASWSPELELVGHLPGALSLLQDVLVLRPRQRASSR